jgi:hypothetical protein
MTKIDEPWEWSPPSRYASAFPEEPVPPLVHWHGSHAELIALMERAIARDRPLTAFELSAAQGMRPAPSGAKIKRGA